MNLHYFLRPKNPSAREYLFPLPYTNESIIKLNWEESNGKFILHANSDSGEITNFIIDQETFRRVNTEKLSGDIYSLTFKSLDSFYSALTENEDHLQFKTWWEQTASSNARLFQFDFTTGPWNIPWELLLGFLKFEETRSRTAIVRTSGSLDEKCNSLQTRSLRTLIIKGNAPDLNLTEEIENIMRAWRGLAFEIREVVKEPIIVESKSDLIINALKDIRPNLLWFSGHGSFDKKVRIHFSEDNKVTAEEFADLFSEAGHCPELAIFWACDTAKGSKKVHARSPELFRILNQCGVSAMVAMQSPIHDFAAIAMSGILFRGLCQGLPIEWSLALARQWFFDQLTMDWASPVVWTSKRVVTHIDIDQMTRFRLQMQLLGNFSIAKGQEGAGLDEEPPDDSSIKQADVWRKAHANIIRGDPKSVDHRIWFLRVLKGIQVISKKHILLIDPQKGSDNKVEFQKWAKDFLSVLKPENGRLPEKLFIHLDLLKENAEIGWRRICSQTDLFLAIIDPPPASEKWFWDPLYEICESFSILTENEIPGEYKDIPANYAEAGKEIDRVYIAKAMKSHQRLLSALAILNIPFTISNFIDTGFESEIEDLIQTFPKLFIKTFGGLVTNTDVRTAVFDEVDEESLIRAYRDCLDITANMAYTYKPHLLEFRISLLKKLGEYDTAAHELNFLLHIYQTSGYQISLLRAATNHYDIREGLSNSIWLDIASNFLQLGDQANARLWLRFTPRRQLDKIYKLELEANYSKNDGKLKKAAELLTQGLMLCEKIKNDSSLTIEVRDRANDFALDCQHDYAMLIHWKDKQYEKAAKEYKTIINTIEDSYPIIEYPKYRHLLACAHRNLGECILYLPIGNPKDKWREAESHFQTALTIELQNKKTSPLIAETQYQLAKLYSKRKQIEDEQHWLIKCINSAEESHHGLQTAIANNRMFWLNYYKTEQKNWDSVAEEWDLIAEHLKVYNFHKWALRTLINANIRVAKELIDNDQNIFAKAYLLENLSILRKNKELRRGSDLERIITTLAGLQINKTEVDNQNYWSLLESEFAEAKGISTTHKLSDPEEAWSKEI
jgi:hypothetical protein